MCRREEKLKIDFRRTEIEKYNIRNYYTAHIDLGAKREKSLKGPQTRRTDERKTNRCWDDFYAEHGQLNASLHQIFPNNSNKNNTHKNIRNRKRMNR